jgi:hypothetical protein
MKHWALTLIGALAKNDSACAAQAAAGRGLAQPILMLSALAAVIVLLLLTAPVARAQTLTTLYSFCSQPRCMDGENPTGALV